MSAVRGSDNNGPSQDGALKYAPRKARAGEAYSPLGLPRAEFDAVLPSSPVGSRRTGDLSPGDLPRGGLTDDLPRAMGRHPDIRGDGTAMVAPRTRLALQPQYRFAQQRSSSASLWAGRITGAAVVVAVGFAGYRFGSVPHATPMGPVAQPASPSVTPLPVAAVNPAATRTQDAGQRIVNALPVTFSPPGKNALPPPPRAPRQQLSVSTVPALQPDTTARLPVSVADAAARSVVVIGGLTPGATVSAGRSVTPTAWRVTVKDLPVEVTPPPGFAGTMDLKVDLHAVDGSIADRAAVRLEWLRRNAPAAPKPAASPKPRAQHDPGEIAQIIRRGEELMRNGDAASARLMYQRAAESGNATAAFRLAETYDPMVRSIGLAPDLDRAHRWYAKAKDLGAPQAAERLDRLARFDQ